MAYSENILPKEAAYYTLSDATIVNGRLSMKAGGSAKIKIDATLLTSIPDSILVNLYTDRLLNPLTTSVIMFLDIILEDGTIQQIGIYPNQLDDKALSFPIELTDGVYRSCELCIQAYIDCDLLVYELCPKQESNVETIIDGVKQSLPHVLYDYNEDTIISRQTESTVAMIACILQGNTDVNGHFLMHFYSTEQCDVYLRFYDNEVEELYAPLKYTVNPGFNSLGVPHAYLKRLAGIHNFIVTCQCTNGQLFMYTRDILFTIDAGHLAERLIDVGMDLQDLTIKQLIENDTPEEIWAIGIDANEVLVKSRPYNNTDTTTTTAWTPKYAMGPGIAAAIEFDGNWVLRNKAQTYTIITEEEPFIFILELDNTLVVYKGDDVTTRKILDTGVTSMSVVRGYKSKKYKEQDQGVICAYIKDNLPCYVNYTYDGVTGNYSWSSPRLIANQEAQEVYVQRLNDYRVGFLVSNYKNNIWYISDRTYVNQGILPENCDSVINVLRYPSLCVIEADTSLDFNGTIIAPEGPTDEFVVTFDYPVIPRIPIQDIEVHVYVNGAETYTVEDESGKIQEISYFKKLSFQENNLVIYTTKEITSLSHADCPVKVIISKYDFGLMVCKPQLHEPLKDTYTFYVPFVPNKMPISYTEEILSNITTQSAFLCKPIKEYKQKAKVENIHAGIKIPQAALHVHQVDTLKVNNPVEEKYGHISVSATLTMQQVGEQPI